MQRLLFSLVLSLFLASVMASAQWHGSGWESEGNSGDALSSSSDSQSESSSSTSSSSTPSKRTHVMIAHAVLATVAWAFFFPMGAILLRLNIKSPIMLKLHIYCQTFAYLIYVAAAGMGIWMAIYDSRYYDSWADPHPIIGLVLLGFATIQPISGWIHHRIYHTRAVTLATTNRGPRPGRTMWGRAHLWLGRGLITLGIVNGSLGLMMLEGSPSQASSVTRNAQIGYGVAAGLMWCIYVLITVIWEWMRPARKRQQVYDNSESSREAKLPSPLSSENSSTHEPNSPARG
ncbi:hypothetical protein GJ744_007301 [Endocarpon pusillum]|uniref:Cytochrome b561 domain-containing protein n=1 Tax=Endocarpon pusillum TaxID=364733 RepID=A0A8H7AL34_9EURO|nr:hypothetical protein GJ744_007301 [Endocarpon pusillum]